jgi:hypothetical protein
MDDFLIEAGATPDDIAALRKAAGWFKPEQPVDLTPRRHYSGDVVREIETAELMKLFCGCDDAEAASASQGTGGSRRLAKRIGTEQSSPGKIYVRELGWVLPGEFADAVFAEMQKRVIL